MDPILESIFKFIGGLLLLASMIIIATGVLGFAIYGIKLGLKTLL